MLQIHHLRVVSIIKISKLNKQFLKVAFIYTIYFTREILQEEPQRKKMKLTASIDSPRVRNFKL